MDKDEARLRVIEYALPHVPFDGWSDAVLARGAAEAGYNARDATRLFPGGPIDALDWYATYADSQMVEAYDALEPKPQRLREKIASLVRLRLTFCTPHREAVRRGLALYALPPNVPRALATTHRTVDEMWHAAGDTSVDFNWYTKRATLAGVYSSTLLFWLNDESEAQQDTWQFLDRRIENVMQFEKFKAQCRKILGVRGQGSGGSK